MLLDLQSEGSAVAVLANLDEGTVSDELQAKGLDLYHASWGRSLANIGNVRSIFEVRRQIRQFRPDVVIVHTPVAAAITRLAARSFRNRPKVAYFVHGFHFQSENPTGLARLWLLAEKSLRPVTDACIVINASDLQLATSAVGYREDAIEPIPGVGLDLSHYHPNPSNARSHIAVVGALDPGKRPFEAIDAVAASSSELPIVFAGRGPLRDELESYAQSSAVQCTFLGRIDDIRPVFAHAAVLLFLSEREGLPRSVLEAVASGIPVVAHRIRGVVDILDGYEWWYEPASRAAEDVAHALEMAIRDQPDAIAMRRSIERFDSRNVVAAHRRIVRKLASRHSHGAS